MARLLFLGASVSQLPGIRHARTAGHEVVACDADPGAIGFELCHARHVVDFSDVDQVERVVREERVDGILAVCTDRAVVPAAVVAERVGLPGIGVDVARRMTHKPTMRARLAEVGVPQPGYVILDGHGPLEHTVPFPAVLKPADSGGQRGVFLLEDERELPGRLAEALEFSRSGDAILEEFVEGTELNALVAVRDGAATLLTLSDRLRPPGRGFGVGWIHSFPTSLPADVRLEVEDIAFLAATGSGLENGIGFAQLIAAGGRVVLVEIAARIAAGQMADLVRHGTGIDLYDIAIAQALGEPVRDELVTPRFVRPIAIRFFTAEPGVLPVGTVTAVDGIEDVRAASGVLDAGLYFDVGTTIVPVQADIDRRGYVVATGATAKDALARADAASTRLRVSVAEEPAQGAAWVRAVPVALVCLLLAATAAAFALSERAKLTGALIAGTRVDKTFSPVCRCSRDVAHVTFRLLHSAAIAVSMVDTATHAAFPIFDARRHTGWLHLVWTGRTAGKQPLPDGVYVPRVSFQTLHRTLLLPSPIRLDTGRPVVASAHMRVLRTAIVVQYRLREPAQVALFVDGRRGVLTRFAPLGGRLRWSERFATGRRLSPGRHRVALQAIDLAGNRSRLRELGTITVRR